MSGQEAPSFRRDPTSRSSLPSASAFGGSLHAQQLPERAAVQGAIADHPVVAALAGAAVQPLSEHEALETILRFASALLVKLQGIIVAETNLDPAFGPARGADA